MNDMKSNPLRILLLCVALLVTAAAHAVDLDSVKSSGAVGERADGYLGFVVQNPDGDVRALVADVNAKRKARYQQIAKRNSISLADVETLAGKKAMEKTPSGGYVFNTSWKRKP